MKKVYIPTMDELQQLQSLKIDIYPYLLAKTIETIVMEDMVYEEEDMFEVAYTELSEFPEILYAIGNMYPEIIETSSKASNDVNLCINLINNLPSQDKSIYHLDNLVYFNQDTTNSNETSPMFNKNVISSVSRILADKLLTNPRYRFDYKEPNALLDSIFACELSILNIKKEDIAHLITIDPVYAIKFSEYIFTNRSELNPNEMFNLIRSMRKLSNRYGFGAELSNPNNKEMKLIRRLEYHRKNYQ